jgi:hypothetical protein
MADRLRPPGPPGGAFSPAVALRGAPGPQLRRRSRGWVSGRRTVHPLADEGRRAAETMLARATDPSFLPTRSPRTTFSPQRCVPRLSPFHPRAACAHPRPADTKSCQRTTHQPATPVWAHLASPPARAHGWSYSSARAAGPRADAHHRQRGRRRRASPREDLRCCGDLSRSCQSLGKCAGWQTYIRTRPHVHAHVVRMFPIFAPRERAQRRGAGLTSACVLEQSPAAVLTHLFLPHLPFRLVSATEHF